MSQSAKQPRRPRRRPGRPRASERGTGSRARLLDAAAEVFAERGFRAATVDQIVAAAGLSKGTFYWNFATKQDLFLALLEERIDTPARALMAITRDAPADRPTASAVGKGLAQLLGEEREALLLLHEYWAAAARDPQLGSRYQERQAALRKELAEALASRHEKTRVPLSVPALDLATAFIALAEGLASAALIDSDAVSSGLYGEILSLVYDGLEARAGR
jgi:AcrR family transcriptional regulator